MKRMIVVLTASHAQFNTAAELFVQIDPPFFVVSVSTTRITLQAITTRTPLAKMGHQSAEL